ncbi:response regulator [Enterovirga sp. CN4-39]|uniref:response regulator n=1 Tax=Enterovirga sp. CN4-39 TaxID=3400910 RepID=UPI003BFBF0B9
MTHAQEARPIALIVEDDAAQRELGAVMLEEFDLDVFRVANAEDAIERLRDSSGKVTVVVADVNLPGAMDGVSLARSVSILWPGISVIVTSGNPGQRLSDLPEGCVYVPKPWCPLDIVTAAERAARCGHSVHALPL